MTTAQAFRKAQITHAVIVDDAFDELPARPLTQEEASGFFAAISDSDFEKIRVTFEKMLSVSASSDDDAEQMLVNAACTLEGTRLMFELEDDISSPKLGMFEDFRTEKKSRMQEIEPLCERLRELDVAVQTFGAEADLSHIQAPQLVFIDLQLKPVAAGNLDANDAIEVYKALLKAHPNIKPFVFLMSSLDVYKKANDFRTGAELFVSQFEAVQKAAFANSGRLDELLQNYSLALFHQTKMHGAIDNVLAAVRRAAEKLKGDLLDLDIADYRVLQANTASIEEMSLGSYVTELVLDYTQYLVEDEEGTWGLSGEIEAWQKEKIARSRFGLRRASGKIYQGTVLHAGGRLKAENAAGLGPANGYFYLGDIFFRKPTKPGERPAEVALCVISPACDLARPEDLKSRTLFLCEGKVKVVDASAVVPVVRGGVAPVVMVSPDDETKLFVIVWNLKRFRAWDHAEMTKARRPTSKWTRVARLRPLYALQLQHALAADLSRIGTQRAPSELIPHGVELLCRSEGKWVSLDRKEVGSFTSAAVSVTSDRTKFAYVISDPTVSRFRAEMSRLSDGSKGKQVAKAVKAIDALKGVDRKLMFCEFETKVKDEKKTDLRVFPLHKSAACSATKETIVFINSTHQTPYTTVGGGKADSPEQKAIFAVKFVPLKRPKK